MSKSGAVRSPETYRAEMPESLKFPIPICGIPDSLQRAGRKEPSRTSVIRQKILEAGVPRSLKFPIRRCRGIRISGRRSPIFYWPLDFLHTRVA